MCLCILTCIKKKSESIRDIFLVDVHTCSDSASDFENLLDKIVVESDIDWQRHFMSVIYRIDNYANQVYSIKH